MRLAIFSWIFTVMCSGLVLADSEPENTDPGVGKSYGDWTEFCETTGNGGKICNISQTLTRQGSQQLLLSIRINYVPGKKQPIVFATLPLGGLLTSAPILKVGTVAPFEMAYQFCDISGCTAVAVIDDQTLGALKAETQAVVQFVNIARKRIGIPVSLRGFSKGLKSLTEMKKK